MKKRLDTLLLERGLAESRSQAQALVLAGLVQGHDKPGEQVDEDAELHVERPPRFVSRGGEKLQHALDVFHVVVEGRDCADVGSSTGGFTDCLLQAGAARVIAIDVGYGQLHPRMRTDPRVTVLERTNSRSLTALPFAPGLVVCDVSFIASPRHCLRCSRSRRRAGRQSSSSSRSSRPAAQKSVEVWFATPRCNEVLEKSSKPRGHGMAPRSGS